VFSEKFHLDSDYADELSCAAGFTARTRPDNMKNPPASGLDNAIENGDFILTAEFTPGLTTQADKLLQRVSPLKDKVTAVNVTDGAGARVAMSSLAAATILQRNGIEPVLQMTCRDRNRIAISADLIGAAALGINNILVLSGDNPGAGDEPQAKGVFDFNVTEIMQLARRMTNDGQINSGRELSAPAAFVVGGVDAPFDPPPEWQPDKLIDRASAGMRFIQTQFCYEPEVTERYVGRLAESGLLESTALIVGIGPIASLRSAKWMDENLFGVSIPDAVMRRLEQADDVAAEGHRICVELINRYREMPGIAGVHIMAPAQSAQRIADVVDALD
jgi:methylenetetrahydrofolate reductase (NADPH)